MAIEMVCQDRKDTHKGVDTSRKMLGESRGWIRSGTDLLSAAFVETTEMAHHTAFFKAYRLSTFRAFLSQEAVLSLLIFYCIVTREVSVLEDAADGIGYGQHQATVLKDRMLPPDAF